MSKILLLLDLLLLTVVQSTVLQTQTNVETNLTKNVTGSNSTTKNLISNKPSLIVLASYTPKEPCNYKRFCGSASNFKDSAQLIAFTANYCPKKRLLQASTDPKASTGSSTDPKSRIFTETNNQETLVDEVDLSKTDGEYIYTISGIYLSIIKSYPSAEAKVVSTLKLNIQPKSLLLQGNYIATIGVQSNNWDFSNSVTYVEIIDVSNKARPRIMRDYKIAGHMHFYSNGRKTKKNGWIYITTSFVCDQSGTVPWYNFGDGNKNIELSKIFYYPNTKYQYPNFINIFAFNLKNPLLRELNLISVLTNTYEEYYMSENAIYLSSLEFEPEVQSTKIYKIFVSGMSLIPSADGTVPGVIANRFGLNQFNGNLRVVTIDMNTLTYNYSAINVFCLNSSLAVIGSLPKFSNLKFGQAKYLDNKLYVQTFKYFDQYNFLYVIDLSLPTLPKLVGTLKIEGYFYYLHSYDAKTLIGIGAKYQKSKTIARGPKVSLIDVSDGKNPSIIADYLFPYYKNLQSNQFRQQTLLFSKENNMFMIPAMHDVWQDRSAVPQSFNGVMVFNIKRDTNGSQIQLRAIVNHLLKPTDNFLSRQVEKSLIIDNLLYTQSRCLLRVTNIETLESVANLEINCASKTTNPPQTEVAPTIFNPPAPLPISDTIRSV